MIDSVRKNVGPDFPVIMRLNAFEGALQPGGIEIEGAVRAAKRFSAHGLDALDISQGSYDIEDMQVPAEVVVLGGGLVGLEATEILCEQGKHVTIVEMAGAVARDVAAYTQQHTRWMLQDYGVDIRVNTRVLSVGPDSITESFDGRTHEIEAMGAREMLYVNGASRER